jgi:hypothetical protein
MTQILLAASRLAMASYRSVDAAGGSAIEATRTGMSKPTVSAASKATYAACRYVRIRRASKDIAMSASPAISISIAAANHVGNIGGTIKSPAERAEEGAVIRQPGPCTEAGIPVPARSPSDQKPGPQKPP